MISDRLDVLLRDVMWWRWEPGGWAFNKKVSNHQRRSQTDLDQRGRRDIQTSWWRRNRSVWRIFLTISGRLRRQNTEKNNVSSTSSALALAAVLRLCSQGQRRQMLLQAMAAHTHTHRFSYTHTHTIRHTHNHSTVSTKRESILTRRTEITTPFGQQESLWSSLLGALVDSARCWNNQREVWSAVDEFISCDVIVSFSG